jgi:UDP:flavonoid glycosyltransferase YjiC (YdhE family)
LNAYVFIHLHALSSITTGGFWADMIGLPRKVHRKEKSTEGVPAIYPISPIVLPPDPKWGANIHVVGYWFLEKEQSYTPSPELKAFLNNENDQRPIVFIGFGSMKVKHADKFTKKILRSIYR